MNIWALCTSLQLLNSALQYKGSYQQYRDKWWSDKTLFMKTDHPSAFGCGPFFVDPWSFPVQVLMLCSYPHTAHTRFALPYFLVGPPVGAVVKNLPASAGDRDLGSVPGLGRSPGGGNGNPLQYSSLKYSTAEELDRLQSMGSQRVRHDQVTEHTHMCFLVTVLQSSLILGWLIYIVLHRDSCVVKPLRVS